MKIFSQASPHIAYALHIQAHTHFANLGYFFLEPFLGSEDRIGLEDAIIAAYLELTDFVIM